MVFRVRCQPVQRHPLHPRRHSRLLRSVHNLCGFRQLRRGAAGDRVPHKPLRTAHAGDVAVSKAPRPALRDSGQDLRVASFLETRKAFRKAIFLCNFRHSFNNFLIRFLSIIIFSFGHFVFLCTL